MSVLAVENLSKSYTASGRVVQALQDVSLAVEPGEFVVVRGASGCGKSTLLLAAGALLTPDAGTVRLAGQDPYALSPDGRAAFRAATVGFVFQRFHLVPYLSVLDNVLTAALAAGGAGRADRAAELLGRFGLTDRADHLPSQLSVGERQRAALARALLNEPKVILADEPTGNLDADNGRTVLANLASYAAAGGAVLLVTHDDLDACGPHRTLRLDRGRLVS